jgi:hypothetical protein
MTTVISGSSPSITFSDSTTQTTAFTSTPSITTITTSSDASISGLTVGKGGGAVSTNTAVGYLAINATATGGNNVAIGYQAATATTTGTSNVSVGNLAFGQNTTGSFNTAVGAGIAGVTWGALGSNTTGANNSAFGYQALLSNTTASNNTAVGYQAGYSNTTGIELTAIGYQAGYGNTTGSSNTSFGYAALKTNSTGSSNHAFGSGALNGNTNGNDNIGIGLNALVVNTTGSSNVGIGRMALNANTTASNGVAVGYQAGYTYTGGSNSQVTYVGYQAGYACTNGSNTFIGYGSGSAMTSGGANTILGMYTGNQGGLDIRTSNNYIVLSDGAGNPQVSIDSNAKMNIGASGFNSGIRMPSTGGTIYIASITSNSQFQIAYNSTTAGVSLASGATSWSSFSDSRLKNVTSTYTNALSDISQIQPVKFTWKNDETNTPKVGVLAQSVQNVVPEAIDSTTYEMGGNTEYLQVRYTELIPLMIASIKELKQIVDTQAAEIAELKAKVA